MLTLAPPRTSRPWPSAISYDSAYRLGQVGYEIGPDKGRRGGALGNIYYFGTSRGGGSGDIDKPLNSEAPRLEKALGESAGRDWGQLMSADALVKAFTALVTGVTVHPGTVPATPTYPYVLATIELSAGV